ncbi:MAG: MOSC N-terminal beta barrel domain-containing protein [Cyclobacteriaceae bacterium]
MKLTEIWIYPVKSLGGIRLKKAKALPKGLEYDRRYMLVDENNRFITQRVSPQLALFKLSLEESVFKITHGNDTIDLPKSPELNDKFITVTIFDDVVQAMELGTKFNQWFSVRADIKCKLIFFPEENRRPVDKDFAVNNEQVSLADGYPFLIIGQRSLDELNTKLEVSVPMNRFRPNFVFDGGKPFEEDNWRDIKIGSNGFTGLKLCGRCVVPTVNQETGEMGKEPLATLSKFRKAGSKVNFGQNLVARNHQEVKEGDKIEIESFQ